MSAFLIHLKQAGELQSCFLPPITFPKRSLGQLINEPSHFLLEGTALQYDVSQILLHYRTVVNVDTSTKEKTRFPCTFEFLVLSPLLLLFVDVPGYLVHGTIDFGLLGDTEETRKCETMTGLKILWCPKISYTWLFAITTAFQ